MLSNKGLDLSRNGWKQFAKNLIDTIRELWKLEKSFCDLTQNDTNTVRKVSKYRVFSGPYFPVFSPNTGKYEPEITPYLDTFHAVK